MRILENIKPAGWDEWAKRAQEKLDKNPEAFGPGASRHFYGQAGGRGFVGTESEENVEDLEWDGEEGGPVQEGGWTEEDEKKSVRMLQWRTKNTGSAVEWEPEPPLEASQYVQLAG